MHFSTSASIFLSFSNITCTRGSEEAVRGASFPLIIQEGETLCCCACRLHCTTFKLGVLYGEFHVHRADVCMCRIPSHPHLLALHIHHPSMPHPLTSSSSQPSQLFFTLSLSAIHPHPHSFSQPSAPHCHNPSQPSLSPSQTLSPSLPQSCTTAHTLTLCTVWLPPFSRATPRWRHIWTSAPGCCPPVEASTWRSITAAPCSLRRDWLARRLARSSANF